MTERELIQFRLRPALDECNLHRQRMHQAWSEGTRFQAMQPAASAALSEDEVRTLDQLVFRFGRLQDAMGVRLLPALLQLVQEWREDEPFIDKLNRAEKLGLLPSAEQWLLLRELRNQTAHEYPSEPERVLANLRRLLASVPVLEQAHETMQAAAQARLQG